MAAPIGNKSDQIRIGSYAGDESIGISDRGNKENADH